MERAITTAEETGDPSYAFDGDRFVRHKRDRNGEADIDACEIEDIEFVAQTIEKDADPHGNGWFFVDELVGPSNRAWLQCLIAVEFMKHAGLLRERALDNRLTKDAAFTADAALAAFKREAGLGS